MQNLESGMKLNEGTESLIEGVLGWELGSLDAIRNGDEPTPVDQRQPTEPEPSLEERLDRLEEAADEWIRKGSEMRNEIAAMRQSRRRDTG